LASLGYASVAELDGAVVPSIGLIVPLHEPEQDGVLFSGIRQREVVCRRVALENCNRSQVEAFGVGFEADCQTAPATATTIGSTNDRRPRSVPHGSCGYRADGDDHTTDAKFALRLLAFQVDVTLQSFDPGTPLFTVPASETFLTGVTFDNDKVA
jgi:hypothetical protein